MDHMPLTDRDFAVDLESGGTTCREIGSVDLVMGGVPLENVKLSVDKKAVGNKVADNKENKSRKERRKTTSAKKPPRPPRPAKAFSLDAADQKLIKEISELAMIKRARVERMKALKKMKVGKASPSTGNLFAMIFTILFCLAMIFQGMSSGKSSKLSFLGSPESAQADGSGFISVHFRGKTSASDGSISGSSSPSMVDQV